MNGGGSNGLSSSYDQGDQRSQQQQPFVTQLPNTANTSTGSTSPQNWSSTTASSSKKASSTTPKNASSEPRRNKACERCRSLKIKCISNPEGTHLPCLRCQKSKSSCVFHLGPRKRTKKADKVAALEKKLEYLTNALQQKEDQNYHSADSPTSTATASTAPLPPLQPPAAAPQAQSASAAGGTASGQPPAPLDQAHIQNTKPYQLPPVNQISRSPQDVSSTDSYGYGYGAAQRSPLTNSNSNTPGGLPSIRKSIYDRSRQDSNHPSLNGTPEDLQFEATFNSTAKNSKSLDLNMDAVREQMMEVWSKLSLKSAQRLEHLDSAPVSKTPSYETDVISQGIITEKEAEARLKIYKDRFYAPFPLVQVPDGYGVEQLRRELPILFLTIMSLASLLIEDRSKSEANMILHNNACETVIYETMMVGSKTFELLQSLTLLTFWYNEPELWHQQKCHLLSNLAIAIASDLGINGATVSTKASLRFEKIVRPQFLVDPKTLECRKMWLAVYCSTLNMTMVVRRQFYSLWNKYTEECCEEVEKADIPESEKRIAIFARLSHTFEEIVKAFSNPDNECPPDVNESRTSWLIKYFESTLQKTFEMNPVARFHPYYHAIQIYLHQYPFYVPFDPCLGRSPFSEFSLAVGSFKASTQSIHCILFCYSSSMKCLDTYLEYDMDEFAVLPQFSLMRIVYSVTTLLKVRALALTNENLEGVIPMDSKDIKKICSIQAKLRKVYEKYPFVNSALSISFALKLIVCHFDRQIYQYWGDDSNGDEGQNQNGYLQQPSQQNPRHPGSPLDILSSAAVNQQADSTQQPQSQSQGPSQPQTESQTSQSQLPSMQQATSSAYGPHGPQQHVQPQPQYPIQVAQQSGGQPLMQQQLQQQQQQQPQQPDDMPFWFMGDDFWKDIVPNVEAFTGYDVM